MGREVGGGFRMGNTCMLMVDSCQCMAKPLQYCKVKKKDHCGCSVNIELEVIRLGAGRSD